MLRSAVEHYRRQQRITALGLIAARIARFDTLDRLLGTVAAFQLTAAQDAAAAVPLMLEEQGIPVGALAAPVLTSLLGVASDGRSLAGLLDYTRTLNVTDDQFDRIVVTQLQDVARQAAAIDMATRPEVTAWVRVLNPPSCSRCAILAGRVYRWSSGFDRHPRCFPAGVTVSGPDAAAATRRLYQGELVVIRTAGGQELPVTGNHPVLTDRGWLPANLVQEGGHVVRSTLGEGAVALVIPDEDQVPARIEDVWGAHRMVSLGEMPTTAQDFHGDGGDGHVDVVLADSLLRYRCQAAACQLAIEEQLARGVAQALRLARGGSLDQRGLWLPDTAGRFVGSGGLLPALLGGHAAGSHGSGGAHAADLDAGSEEPTADGSSADVQALAEAVFALAGTVGQRDGVGGQDAVSPRWDAPASPFTVESRAAYAAQGNDLRLRLAGQVALDRVVEVTRKQWSGHVYNLTSVEGWYSANGLIVSNCDCRHVPTGSGRAAADLVTDPREYFDSLAAAGQDATFTAAGAEAIRLGADPAKVVNARRGMSTAQVYGRDVRVTSEGTARAGRNATPRLMPESILEIAQNDRKRAVQLLTRFGYVQ